MNIYFGSRTSFFFYSDTNLIFYHLNDSEISFTLSAGTRNTHIFKIFILGLLQRILLRVWKKKRIKVKYSQKDIQVIMFYVKIICLDSIFDVSQKNHFDATSLKIDKTFPSLILLQITGIDLIQLKYKENYIFLKKMVSCKKRLIYDL